MNSIWKSYELKKITTKEALELLSNELLRKGLTKNEHTLALITIEKVLDAEVPMSERDHEAEEIYSAKQRMADEE